MARKRMIAPSIWEDPSFNKLGVTARLAFVGMISNADDDGYLRGDHGSLKRLVFGFDETLSDNMWLEELKKYKNIHFFESCDESYCHLLNWDKYQTQRDDRRQDSIYPKCTICQASDGQVTAEVKEVSKLSKEKLSKDKEMYGEFKNVLLSLEEYQKLVNTLGEKNTNILITELDTYIASKGKRYSNHYATILNWARRRVMDHKQKVESKKANIAFK